MVHHYFIILVLDLKLHYIYITTYAFLGQMHKCCQPPRSCHPVIFDCLDRNVICHTALCTEGSAGPSGVDALGWRHSSTSFWTVLSDLCHSLALVAKHISTSFADPDALQPILNCWSIALHKNPGIYPIGIGKTSRRITANAVVSVVKQDVLDTASYFSCAQGNMSAVQLQFMLWDLWWCKFWEYFISGCFQCLNFLNCHATLLNMFHLY